MYTQGTQTGTYTDMYTQMGTQTDRYIHRHVHTQIFDLVHGYALLVSNSDVYVAVID